MLDFKFIKFLHLMREKKDVQLPLIPAFKDSLTSTLITLIINAYFLHKKYTTNLFKNDC